MFSILSDHCLSVASSLFYRCAESLAADGSSSTIEQSLHQSCPMLNTRWYSIVSSAQRLAISGGSDTRVTHVEMVYIK